MAAMIGILPRFGLKQPKFTQFTTPHWLPIFDGAGPEAFGQRLSPH
jgi:hypothetical protein